MVLKITEDGMRRLEAHVKSAQDDPIYDDSHDVEDQIDELDMENLGLAHEIISAAVEKFMEEIRSGLEEAKTMGYLEKDIKGHFVDIYNMMMDESWDIKSQLIELIITD